VFPVKVSLLISVE